MARPRTWYALFSLLSGAVWGAVAYVLASNAFGVAVWGGVLASPLIGLLIGLAFKWIRRIPTSGRVFVSLLSLYVSAVLFGLGVGLVAMSRAAPSQIPTALLLEPLSAVLWGITFTGYILILWPMSYLTHSLLGRLLKGEPVSSRSNRTRQGGAS